MKYLDILWDDFGAMVMLGSTTNHYEYFVGSKAVVWSQIEDKFDTNSYQISEAHVDDFDMPEYDYEDAY